MPELNNILKRCQNNDRAAQKLLYQRHKDRLMGTIYRYANDITLAQDLLQETFIKIFTNLKSFDAEKGSFKSWSSRIAINEYLQAKRKKNELSFDDGMPEVIGETESALMAKLTVKELKITIAKMPEIHRTILNLYYFESYTHKEISELLGIKPSSSRAQLTRAKKQLESIWYNLNLSATL